MNAKYSPSTSRRILLTAGAVLCALALHAQEPWREGRNTGGLACYEASEGEARLDGSYTWGGYRLPSEAASLWKAGASARAETHYKDMVLTGNFSFDVQNGKDMMGSMFTQSGYYPIDVLEFTPGDKTMQTYRIGGGMAWTGHERWIPGISLRFQGVNYSKRKDIRHTTYRQEAEITPSLLYRGDRWRFGASYSFQKSSEFIQAEQIGSATAQTYYAFLDKGMRYGTCQAWDGSGIHLNETGLDRLPVQETVHVAALQASLEDALYAQLEYHYRQGEAGEKGYTWFRFPGHAGSALVIGNLPGKDGLHSLKLQWDWGRQDNYETVLDRVTEGGVTTPREFGSNRIYVFRGYNAQASYTYQCEKGWSLGAGVLLERTHEQGTYMYPYLDYDAGGKINLMLEGSFPLGPLTLEAGLAFRTEVTEDHWVVDTDESEEGVTSKPFRLSEWWEKEEEYDDAPRLNAVLSLRYPFTLARTYKFYVEAGLDYTRAFGTLQLLPGSSRQCTRITLGYNF